MRQAPHCVPGSPGRQRWGIRRRPDRVDAAGGPGQTRRSLGRRPARHGRTGANAREIVVGKLFGTDGVRGVANTELTPELAMALGRAVVGTIGHDGPARPVIVVGRDPRASGALLEGALVAGILSAG